MSFSYPSMNSSHNVSTASLRVMQREFIRGMNIVGLNIDKKSTPWADLFEPTNFFDKFPLFIEVSMNVLCCAIVIWTLAWPPPVQICVSSKTAEDHLLWVYISITV